MVEEYGDLGEEGAGEQGLKASTRSLDSKSLAPAQIRSDHGGMLLHTHRHLSRFMIPRDLLTTKAIYFTTGKVGFSAFALPFTINDHAPLPIARS